MKYNNIISGIFISRPNRFIAMVEVNGKEEICHVKNTGRCKELLIKGVTVFLEGSDNPNRKTKYSVIGVKKGQRLINMDSQAPNKVVGEWITSEDVFKNVTLFQPEKKYGNSRFDFYIETGEGERKIFIEVKGVTLEENGIVRFPDAPTQRGLKHILELCDCIDNGYEAYIIFVIQMKDVMFFEPNVLTQPAFGAALQQAKEKGVNIQAYDCWVEKDMLKLADRVEVKLFKYD